MGFPPCPPYSIQPQPSSASSASSLADAHRALVTPASFIIWPSAFLQDAASVRADQPIPPQAGVYYFEVTVISRGQKGYIGVGFSTRNVDLERLPGWNTESYGYHGDDGKAFASSGTGQAYGPRFTSGDVIGCGIDFVARRAFFVKNGQWLGYVFDLTSALRDPATAGGAGQDPELPPAQPGSRRERERERERKAKEAQGRLRFYPTIGLQTVGETVKVNFGQDNFVFDIESFVKVGGPTPVWPPSAKLRLNPSLTLRLSCSSASSTRDDGRGPFFRHPARVQEHALDAPLAADCFRLIGTTHARASPAIPAASCCFARARRQEHLPR